jgi:hypothetical protein
LRKKYRKLKTRINIQLGTLESIMSMQNYDKLNLNKVSPNALKNHKHNLMKIPELAQKINDFELDNSKILFEFTKQYLK